MSDATLPPRTSEERGASADGNRSDESSGDGDSDTSLMLGEALVAREEILGDGEGKTDNKQRRKRTSPKDQATLEAEYKLNPKPNKAARADIVEKVDLNEKEVQIWFQNRRQIQRRKSRPLLPHEIAAFGIGILAGLSSNPTSVPIFSSSQSMHEPAMGSQEDALAHSQEQPEPLEPQRLEECVESAKSKQEKAAESTPASSIFVLALKGEPLSGILGVEGGVSVEGVIKSFSSTPGYLSNRWNAINSSFSTPAPSQITQFVTPPISNPIHPSSCPDRLGFSDSSTPSSQVRLSMSLDGKAELISSEPSPPRAHTSRPSSSGSAIPQKRMRGLQRSQSAFSFSPLSQVSVAIPFVPRLPRGRSRDARTWRFACDAEARDELTTQAENESNGSAVAAINLLRSTSKSGLKPNSNKCNAPSTKQDSTKHGKRLKLERAQSSLARLQSSVKESRPPSSKGKVGLMHSPSGDSDKENWVPHGGGGNARRRPLPSGRSDKQHGSKPVLGDYFNPSTRSAYLDGSKNKRRKVANVAPDIFEDEENSGDVGEEVEKFMRGEISPSKKGDLDCVQGLLSLSQGNWR